MSKLRGTACFQERKAEEGGDPWSASGVKPLLRGDRREKGPGPESGVQDRQLWLVKRLQCEEEGLFSKGRAA